MRQNVILDMKTESFLTVVVAVEFQSTQYRKCIAILGTYMLYNKINYICQHYLYY